MRRYRRIATAMTLVLGAAALSVDAADGVADRFTRVARSLDWQLVDTVPVQFPTHHPQGMVKIGDRIYFSTVEILERTERYPELRDGMDRSAGKGVGHLFEMDLRGTLLREITLGEGDVYHPGGIDFDGIHIWVPVAEYRPNSRSILYQVDPKTMRATKVLTFADHVGGIVHDTAAHTLHGVSWGSRRFYRWTLDRQLKVTNATAKPEALRKPNPAFYIDYQDCHHVGGSRMLCSGLNNYRMKPDGPPFPLGGIELVDLKTDRPLHQIPVALWTDTGVVMTQNPFWVEPSGAGLRFYFMPEDDKSRLFIYDAKVN
jgi:Family of unknown function (DUF6454)